MELYGSGIGAFEVKGLDELKDQMKYFETTLKKSLIRKASYKASSVPIKMIRQLIETYGLVQTGAMKKRLGAKVIQRRGTDQIVLIVGSLRTPGATAQDRHERRKKLGITRDPFYIRFQEFGTENIQGRHFVEEAFKRTNVAYTEAFVENLKQGIDNHFRKKAKKLLKAVGYIK